MRSFLKRTFIVAAVMLGSLVLIAILFLRFGIYHPSDPEVIPIQTVQGSTSKPLADTFKVVSYNVQYFAGKGYVFFYDMEGFAGPDLRPSTESITLTLDQIASFLLEQDADVVLLQEIDDGASRTDRKDQTQQLLERLGDTYAYYAEAFYWKAAFVPHPKIAGSVGMKLTTLSKAPITRAIRHSLPRIQQNPISDAFNFKRAVLETHLVTEKGDTVVLLNTHLDAFAGSSETMLAQVKKVDEVLRTLDAKGLPWIIGGDFNLLPPIEASRFDAHVQQAYAPHTELALLYERYQAIPSLEALASDPIAPWFTHFPNHPDIPAPDRIIDYLFYSDLVKLKAEPTVVQGEALTYSDHLPLVATFVLQPGARSIED